MKTDRSQGSDAHDIVDAWVYVNSKFIGTFELPATIPVLEEGMQEISILAGIKKNSQANNRIVYPFYTSFETSRELIPSNVDTISPTVSYRPNAQFVWLEDFEDQTNSLEKSGANSTVDSLVFTSDPSEVFAYDGVKEQFSIKGVLDTGYQIFEFSSTTLFDPPRGGAEVFLELNFKTEIELITGYYPVNAQVITGIPLVNYFPTTVWKKAYISLKEEINAADKQNTDIRIFFGAIKNNVDSTANVYLDNIKLIHF